ncbi:GTP 3',8-cyclase MoaA [Clostridium sp.]|uniref:GTP 3',8-cyclase MoaA n=1 Tax=Clostridium sp. TaxID=1506 RepID=UPI003463A8B2
MKDNLGREINYMRISLTDRCNLRCNYCMPPGYDNFFKEEDMLSLDEIYTVAQIGSELGISKFRFTGGEPLVREGIENLIKKVKKLPGVNEIAITTNGILLPEKIKKLKESGLDRVNISLDSFKEDRFKSITNNGDLKKVLKAIDMAIEHKIEVSLNVVIVKGKNQDEIMDFIRFSEEKGIKVRFIEIMPIGKGKDFIGMTSGEIEEVIKKERTYIEKETEKNGLRGPALYKSFYNESNGKTSTIGFISPMSSCFCSDCNRIRLTCDGFLKQCLHWNSGTNLRPILRDGKTYEEVKEIIKDTIYNKPTNHNFGEKKDNADIRFMSQIGG